MLPASDKTSLLREGQRAPDFTATLSSGEKVSLSSFLGKSNVVLFFYPKDFTPGCTREACGFRDHYDVFKQYDVVLLGVSTDSEASHQSFIQAHHLPFPLIADTDGRLSRLYGADNRLWGLIPGSKRITYVVDKSGIIRSVIHHEILIGRHIDGVEEVLKVLKNETL